MTAALNIKSLTSSDFPAYSAHMAISRISNKLKLNRDAICILTLFAHLLKNDDGQINMDEIRWDSRSEWCRQLHWPIDDKSKKKVSRAFGELVKKGLMTCSQDEKLRTLRQLTPMAKKLIMEFRDKMPKPTPVRVLDESDTRDESVPPANQPGDESFPTQAQISEPELYQGTASKNLKPLSLVGGGLKGNISTPKNTPLYEVRGALRMNYEKTVGADIIKTLVNGLLKRGHSRTLIRDAALKRLEKGTALYSWVKNDIEAWDSECRNFKLRDAQERPESI